MPIIPATQETEIRKIMVQSQPGKIVHKTQSQKYPTQNRTGRMTQVAECLPSKCEALNLSSKVQNPVPPPPPKKLQ
jgi:hypothetical protein